MQFRLSRVRDKVRFSVRDRVGLELAMVLGLARFTFCHTSSPQKPASPQARILPKALILCEHSISVMGRIANPILV